MTARSVTQLVALFDKNLISREAAAPMALQAIGASSAEIQEEMNRMSAVTETEIKAQTARAQAEIKAAATTATDTEATNDLNTAESASEASV